MEGEMDLLTLYKRTQSAASQLGGVLNMARLNNYNDVNVFPDAAVSMLARDAESAASLFQELDVVTTGIAWLKQEVESRRAAAVK
jgi:hypothetical protein